MMKIMVCSLSSGVGKSMTARTPPVRAASDVPYGSAGAVGGKL
jgi:hypothetical protein